MRRFFVLFLLILPLLIACGEKEERPVYTGERALTKTVSEAVVPETEEEQEEKTGQTLYLLTGINTAEGELSFRRISDGMEGALYYHGGTFFYDRYGTIIALSNFHPGNVVKLSLFEDGSLSAMQMSDEVFTLKDRQNYDLDLDRMVLTVDDTNYRLTKDVPVYVAGKDAGVFQVKEGDSLDITGLDKDIISLTVTTGLGSIELKNIGVFENGWLNLDNEYYYQVKDDMEISAEEGTHVLTVANDGWGDSTVISVKRGEKVSVDLDALKGDGPKYCSMTVTPNVEGATVELDGQPIDAGEPASVRYGQHVLTVEATGYETWRRKLVVNSEESEIKVELVSTGSSAGGTNPATVSGSSAVTAEQTEEGKGAAGTLAGSLANSHPAADQNNSGSSQRQAEQAAAEKMLDTMSGMLDTLTGTSLNSGND